MAAEVIAFSDFAGVALSLSDDLKDITGTYIPVNLFADSKRLFDDISRGSRTSVKRTMIDVYAARQAFTDRTI